MDQHTMERLERFGNSENAWEKVSSIKDLILNLRTVKRTLPSEGEHYWPNGVPTVNLPELEI